MLERLTDLPEGIEGLRAIGIVSREDFDAVVVPNSHAPGTSLLDEARREGRRIKLLYELGPEFKGFTAGAAWADARIGLSAMRLIEACAVVTDVGWIRRVARFADFFMPGPVRVFDTAQRAEAIEWLASLEEQVGMTHRLLPDRGVIVIEVKGSLRVQDIDALTITADSWIESHGGLCGLVIHAREFPGWESLDSFVRHVRFMRDHHRQIRRVALAVDSKLASLMPRIAEHFIQAEIRNFGYDELDQAIEWASDVTPSA